MYFYQMYLDFFSEAPFGSEYLSAAGMLQAAAL
jgi:hypothetical protein